MNNQFPFSLPATLANLLRGSTWQADTLGQSHAKTYRLEQSGSGFYLKICAVEPVGGLQSEADALVWLGQHLPAPEVVHYERSADIDYLLIREVPGQPASDARWAEDPERLARCLGESLRALHTLDVAACPFNQRLEVKLHDVARNVALGLVDEDDFDDENLGVPPAQLLKRLIAERPADEDVVVTHGDFCLPNVLLHNWQLSVFIDVGRLGLADRYQDLAVCTGCLADALASDRHTATFLDGYGIRYVDEEKLRYYRLLNELI